MRVALDHQLTHRRIAFRMTLTLNQLIERLQQLHIEQERILQELESIAAADEQVSIIAVADGQVSIPEPVSIPSIPDTVPVPVALPAPFVRVPPITFHIGQRVYIINRITHVLVRRVTEDDRTAIVTHFTPSRIAIRTINGFHTHRHPKNLRPL